MAQDLTVLEAPRRLQQLGLVTIPAVFAEAGPQGAQRFIEFFTATIRNRNTREAYARAVSQFAAWCEAKHLHLPQLNPFVIAAYVEELGQRLAKPTVKQHLAAIRMLFDWLVTGQVVPLNPAHAVRGPKHVVNKGKTPVLTAAEARALLDAIDHAVDETGRTVPKEDSQLTVAELRDRALIGVMVYSFARVSAVVGMNVEDYFQQGKRWWFRLHEKGGKRHDVPAHHNAEAYMDAYLARAGIAGAKKTPLFRSLNRKRQLTERRMHRLEVLAMVKRRARRATLSPAVCCHTFRATGITAYQDNGGTIEHAQRIAAHESLRTTKSYDLTSDEIILDSDLRMVPLRENVRNRMTQIVRFRSSS
jgi:site-specific recombinase XerD